MTFAEKIKKFMDSKGLDNRTLSKKINKAESRVSTWKKAEKPSLEFVMSIVKVYPDFDLNYYLKDQAEANYPELEGIESEAAEERGSYGQTATDIIEEIESKLILLKEKVAQNSHK